MPNHIYNRLTVVEGDYDLGDIKSFNDVIPMPQELKDTSHSGASMQVEQCLGITKSFFGDRPTINEVYSENDKEEVDNLFNNYIKYGHTTWYGWSVENWGTKLDMYGRDCSNKVLTFQTAWRTPVEWYKEFAKTLPEGVVIKVEYASEDIGEHTGELTLTSSGAKQIEYSSGSFEAYELAVELQGLHNDLKFIGDEWVWVDDIEDEE